MIAPRAREATFLSAATEPTSPFACFVRGITACPRRNHHVRAQSVAEKVDAVSPPAGTEKAACWSFSHPRAPSWCPRRPPTWARSSPSASLWTRSARQLSAQRCLASLSPLVVRCGLSVPIDLQVHTYPLIYKCVHPRAPHSRLSVHRCPALLPRLAVRYGLIKLVLCCRPPSLRHCHHRATEHGSVARTAHRAVACRSASSTWASTSPRCPLKR